MDRDNGQMGCARLFAGAGTVAALEAALERVLTAAGAGVAESPAESGQSSRVVARRAFSDARDLELAKRGRGMEDDEETDDEEEEEEELDDDLEDDDDEDFDDDEEDEEFEEEFDDDELDDDDDIFYDDDDDD